MKKTNFITGSFLMLFAVILISCSGGSVKGNWSDADKEKFNAEMKKAGLEDQALIDCYFSKCEATYSSFAEADSKEGEDSELVVECLANGSVLGNWSDADKAEFRAEAAAEGAPEEWTECYLLKCEAAFQSKWHADFEITQDETIATQFAIECMPTEEVAE